MFGRFRASAALAVLAALFSLAACVSHLREAKAAYAEAQELARGYRTARAVAAYKRALSEAGLEVRRDPSAQAFMVKGLAEANLGLWPDAETSFVKAAGLGFEPGEAWASDVALLGLAVSFEELGLPDPALRAYENILAKSGFKPVLMTAAERYADLTLARALALDEKDKARALAGLVRAIEKLEAEDFACGLYHYLHSQAEGHRGDYRRSYDEAVAARELGLPSEKIFRDNDNQIVFCFDELGAILDDAGRETLAARHAAWTKKWGWKDARTPDWKEASEKD
jgi:tetratricopeptide (TPR) repeat protein